MDEHATTSNSIFNATDLSKLNTETEQFLRIICVDFATRLNHSFVTKSAEEIYAYITTGNLEVSTGER
jgi:hypothetical protein